MKNNVRKIFWLYTLLFVAVAAFLGKYILFDSTKVIANPYNPRAKNTAADVTRGGIRDAAQRDLAVSFAVDDGFLRVYPYGPSFAHLVGYADYGKSGLEARYNFELQRLDWELFQRYGGLANDWLLRGNSLALTVDAELQQMIYELYDGKYNGAAAVMEPSTGKILAMVSVPSFDPNNVAINWDSLRADQETSPLINRASQGLYPPGSVFKIVTAAAAYTHLQTYEDFEYTCEGSVAIGDSRLRCFNGNAHGSVGIHDGFAVSCNGCFAQIGMMIGGERLRETAERFLFNAPYAPPFPYNASSFTLDSSSGKMEIAATSIGQGKTLTNPMHMAMIVSAVANGGILMEPYVVDHIESGATGSVKNKRLPEQKQRIMEFDEAEFLKGLMVQSVRDGTGRPAQLPGAEVAGKTGTAENAGDAEHGWFVAFAPADNPKAAVAVLVENAGGSGPAIEIAKKILAHVLDQSS